MKILIWLGCIAVYSVVVTACRFGGVTFGALPTVLLLLVLVVLPAPALCRQLDKKREAREGPVRREAPEEISEEQAAEIKNPALRARAELYRNSAGSDAEPEKKPWPAPGEKLCGTPFIQAGQTPPGVETEQPKPGKRSPVVPLCIAAALLVVCTCILGCRVSVLTAARDDLAAENAELRSRVSALSTEKTQLQEKVNDLEARNEDLSGYLHDATFLYNNIGFIVEGSNRYHNYDCPVFQGADEYWAHNIEYCEYLGYSKCGNCW